jgi:hypothetical protein
MAESERYLPSLLDKLDAIMRDAGLEKDPIVIRMTGCPNGCARPYLAEIGLVGKNLGKYNLYLGGGFVGDRLNKLYREESGRRGNRRDARPDPSPLRARAKSGRALRRLRHPRRLRQGHARRARTSTTEARGGPGLRL